MPIPLHLALAFVARAIGFLAACLAASCAMWTVGTWLILDWEKASRTVGVPLVALSAAVMFASAYAGIRAGNWLALRLAARCPICGGRAWGTGCRVVRYRCESCGHEETRRTERG